MGIEVQQQASNNEQNSSTLPTKKKKKTQQGKQNVVPFCIVRITHDMSKLNKYTLPLCSALTQVKQQTRYSSPSANLNVVMLIR
eukprot:m.38654 g.38654  ORF g.38654 m.38654 type:complete len:84 (-) comp10223_c1_seq2:56-307(-)